MHGSFLRSIYSDVLWMPGEPMKGDINTEHKRFPHYRGVFAFKEPEGALEAAMRAGEGSPWRLRAVGRVMLYGEVMEHEDGFRGSYAQVESIDMILPRIWSFRLPNLRILYRV